MEAARHQPAIDAFDGALPVEMEILRVVLQREVDDAAFGEGVAVRFEALADLEVVEPAPGIACGHYQLPVFSMVAQGSAGSRGPPAWSSSMEMPSGERMNAM